ncbi:MAG TPA: redox-sensing transcriptional repressor Rex [Sedimentisphaerales bacterium]|nr:redox-sensing transcriptional repressor Rex [Sedimentisphaerales bacterium]
MSKDREVSVPLPTIRRLPMYFALLQRAAQESQTSVSSSQLAGALGLEPIQVRKDLEAVGVTGQPRVGFPVAELIQAIERFLGWDNVTDAFIIGAGHLGTALAGYHGFESKGLNVVALFDNDPRKIGQTIHGKEVLSIDKLGNLASRLHVHIAILTVPAEVAASVAQLAIDAGIQAIWNFTPTKLVVPEHVILERVDLAASLAVLSSKLAARLRPVEPTVQTQETQAGL